MKKSIRFFSVAMIICLIGTVLTGCTGGSENANAKTQKDTTKVENNSSNGEPIYGGEVSVGIAQDLGDSLDPHYMEAAGTREVLFNVFEGLVKPTPEGDLIPAVAESFNIDGKTYTFTLREGIKFHNGDLVTVDDIVYSIKRCADTSEGTPIVPAFSVVENVEAIDDRTVVITIDEPNNDFLAYLTSAIIPKGYENQATSPVGTGPFKFVSRSPQENFVVEKFDEYWGDKAYLDKVTYKILESDESMIMSLRSGAVDMISHLPSSKVPELGDGFTIYEGTMNLVQAVYLNNAVEPFNNEDVRKALCHAVNIQDIMDLTADGRGTPLGSSIYPAFKKYFMPELAEYYTYDPQKAKDMLAKAGYPNGFDMVITVPSNYQYHVDVAEVAVEQFRAIGINASIETVEWSTWLSDIYTGRKFQSTVIGVDSKTMSPRAMLERFVSDNGKNFINFNDPNYDELFKQAIAETDDAKQVELYKGMEKILAERAANVYLQDLADLVVVNPKLGGIEFYPMYVRDMAKVYYTE